MFWVFKNCLGKFLDTKVTTHLGDHWIILKYSFCFLWFFALCARSAAVCGGLTQQRLWEIDCDRSTRWSDAGERAHGHVGRLGRSQYRQQVDASWKLLMLVEPQFVLVNHGKAIPTHSAHFKSVVFWGLFLWRFCGIFVQSPIYACPIKVPPPQPHLLCGLGQWAASCRGCATNADEARCWKHLWL